MYLFLGIFPSCRPKAIRKNHEIAFFDPKDKRKEEKTLSSPFIFSLSLSLSPQRDHARESVVPSLSVVVGVVVVVYVITRFRERKDDVSLNYFNYFNQKKGSSRKVKVKVPPSCELTTTTTNTNTNTSKKKTKRGEGICV